MEQRYKQAAARGAARTEPSLDACELWRLLSGEDPWRLDGLEALLDWIEKGHEVRR